MNVSVNKKGVKNAKLHNKSTSSTVAANLPGSKQCPLCGAECSGGRALVRNGQFYKNVCGTCRSMGNHIPIDAKYSKERDREAYGKELLQPFQDGKANPDFILAYPDLKDMFTQEEIQSV